jgi:hypothetical protein
LLKAQLISTHYLRPSAGRLVYLDLRAHFLGLGSENLHSPLLLGDRLSQFLNFLVRFEELVEQHRVDLLVVDAHDSLSLRDTSWGIHLNDLLGDQTVLRRAFPVAVEFEGY